MTALERMHPAQLCLGAVLFAEEKAKSRGQMLIETICADACTFARETTDLLREIATDADYLVQRIHAAAEDGVFSPDERTELHALAAEIEEEARTGRIIQ